MHNPLRRSQKSLEQHEEPTAELSSVIDNTVRYARLFWSLLGLIAVSGALYLYGIDIQNRLAIEKERNRAMKDYYENMITAVESKNYLAVPVPESVYKKMKKECVQ